MKKQIAMVTGAGSGIGRAVTLALFREGYKVVLAGRRRSALEETASKAGTELSDVLIVPTDIRDPHAVLALFSQTKAKFGRLDLLFNNAGISTHVPFEDLSYEKWQDVVNTNLTGTFLCTQEAFRLMKDQKPRGGRIINNGSISAHSPRPDSVSYTATKHAITGLTRSTSLDGRKYDIACGQIDIGNALTELGSKMAKGVTQPDGSKKSEPVMDVEHAAQAVLHMASLPPDTNILFMTIMATKMPFVGRG